jgi:hypothetical protein
MEGPVMTPEEASRIRYLHTLKTIIDWFMDDPHRVEEVIAAASNDNWVENRD